ncbi:MAG: nucleotide exchange factor GrpE [Bacteroidia bacterium]|nr:nucleotide exchange factor GrpE [Bacteroidia bacterium]MDW8134925.1 nucleotide exchange factor GrpE [Bacteroidia bacterium]
MKEVETEKDFLIIEPSSEAKEGELKEGSEPQQEPQESLPTTEELIQKLSQEVEYWKDQALRARADLENYRRRIQRDLPHQLRQAQADILTSLLPLLDGIERGLQAAQEAPDIEKLKEGISLLQRQFVQTLQRLEVTVIQPEIGDLPNPEIHEVLSTVPAPEGIQPHSIMEVVEAGYRFRGQLLRPARVIVSE